MSSKNIRIKSLKIFEELEDGSLALQAKISPRTGELVFQNRERYNAFRAKLKEAFSLNQKAAGNIKIMTHYEQEKAELYSNLPGLFMPRKKI